MFDKSKSKLGACHGINKVASKFIAHAADAGSRGQVSEKERRVTLDRIQVCQRLICRVAAYINDPLLYIRGSNLIPIPQYENLANLEKDGVDPEKADGIAELW